MNKAIKFSIGLIFSAIGLYYAFRSFDWQGFASAFKQINMWYIVVAVMLQLSAVWFRSLRWKWLLEPFEDIPIKPLYEGTMIGYFGNTILPFRMGELLRAYVVSNACSTPVSKLFGSIIVDRVLDLLGLVLLTLVLMIFFDLVLISDWIVFTIITATIIIFTFLVILGKNEPDWTRIQLKYHILQSKLGSKFYSSFTDIISGLSLLTKTTKKIRIYSFVVLLWSMYFFSFAFVVKAMSLELSWPNTGILMIVLSLVISIPAAPGFIGTYHGFSVLFLTEVFGVGMSASQSFAVISHAVVYIPFVVVGAVFFLRSSMTFSKIKSLEITNS